MRPGVAGGHSAFLAESSIVTCARVGTGEPLTFADGRVGGTVRAAHRGRWLPAAHCSLETG